MKDDFGKLTIFCCFLSDELQILIRTFLNHSDVKARERFGNMTLSQ